MTPDFRSLIRNHLRQAALPPVIEQRVTAELTQHLEDRYRDGISRGLSHDDALASAMREIAGHEHLAHDLRAVTPRAQPPAPPIGAGGGSWWSGLWQDVTYATRTLRRTPAFTMAAVVTIALSTGPTLGALGVANWLFWRPVAEVQNPDQLGVVWFGRWNGSESFSPWRISYGHLRDMSTTFTSIAEVTGESWTSVNLSVPGQPARTALTQVVMGNYFDVLGVRFSEGRGFRPEEDRDPGGATVAVISPALARALFPGASPLGQSIEVNGTPFAVVGVVPEAFRGLETGQQAEVWLPGLTSPRLLHLPPDRWDYEPHRGPFSSFVIRLAPGATFTQAQDELTAAAAGLAASGTPDTEVFQTRGPTVFPGVGLGPFARGSTWRTVRLLLLVGALLVALGAANLANLFIFRGFSRTHEAAVRRALGASASRLARLQVLEALMVSVTGAFLGLTIVVGLQALLGGAPIQGLGPLEMPIDWRVLSLALVVATGVGVVLSVAPVRLASRVSLTGMLAQGARGSSRPGARLRTGLAVVQLALSLTLLAGGLLFMQTLQNLRGVDLGFNPAGVTTVRFPLRGQGYDSARSMQFYRDLLSRLAPQPGVDAVAAAMSPPLLGGSFRREVHLPGRDPKTESVEVLTNDVTADYFRVVEIELVAGRTFTPDEAFATGPEPGVVISRSLAERLFDTPNAVGRLLTFPAVYGAPSHDVPVIGVAADTKWRGIDAAPDLLVYRPVSDSVNGSMLMIRSTQPADAVRLVREEVARLDPSLPVGTDLSMASIIERRLSQQRLFAWVLGVLAALGFVLAAIGVHGLTSQVTRERWREFGIRIAIGATRADIVRLVLRGGLTVVALGVPLGIGAAALASGAIESQLFGVERLAPTVYVGAAMTLLVVVLLASLAPALRASRTNPVDVLRVE